MISNDKNQNGNNMNRRSFLKVAAIGAVGAAGAAVFGVQGTEKSGAASVNPNLAQGILDNFSYKGRSVQIMNAGGQQMLHLNGVAMPSHVFSKTDAGYASHLLPFENFANSRDLVKKLVDNDGKLFILGADNAAMQH